MFAAELRDFADTWTWHFIQSEAGIDLSYSTIFFNLPTLTLNQNLDIKLFHSLWVWDAPFGKIASLLLLVLLEPLGKILLSVNELQKASEMAKKLKLIMVPLGGEPFGTPLFCPYCASPILSGDPKEEGSGDCPHLLYAGFRQDLEDETKQNFREGDLCFHFVSYIPGESMENLVIFRGP